MTEATPGSNLGRHVFGAAVATTVFFALAAVALLTNRMAVLASRLLTLMIVSFGLIV
jgi:hypothetical protein